MRCEAASSVAGWDGGQEEELLAIAVMPATVRLDDTSCVRLDDTSCVRLDDTSCPDSGASELVLESFPS